MTAIQKHPHRLGLCHHFPAGSFKASSSVNYFEMAQLYDKLGAKQLFNELEIKDAIDDITAQEDKNNKETTVVGETAALFLSVLWIKGDVYCTKKTQAFTYKEKTIINKMIRNITKHINDDYMKFNITIDYNRSSFSNGSNWHQDSGITSPEDDALECGVKYSIYTVLSQTEVPENDSIKSTKRALVQLGDIHKDIKNISFTPELPYCRGKNVFYNVDTDPLIYGFNDYEAIKTRLYAGEVHVSWSVLKETGVGYIINNDYYRDGYKATAQNFTSRNHFANELSQSILCYSYSSAEDAFKSTIYTDFEIIDILN